MPIKVSQIIKSDTVIENDGAPILGGPLSTNNFQIQNNGNSVNITGNNYPVTNGLAGQVLSSDGAGNIVFATVPATQLELYSETFNNPVTPQALGTNSIALGDAATTSAAAPGSLAIGSQSLSRNPGAVVQANGRFSSTGDAQSGRYLLRSHTIDGVPTELFIDGTAGSIRLVLPDDATWVFKVTITAHRTDVSDGHAGYVLNGVIYRGSGANTTALQGSVQRVVLSESDVNWDIGVTADQTNGSLNVIVQGTSGKIVRWVALVETVEITN